MEILLLLLLTVGSAWGADPLASPRLDEWTRFRGPNGSGIGSAAGIPATWSEADYNWKVALPGKGHSSPVLWGDRIFVTGSEATPARRMVLCLKTGERIGQEKIADSFYSSPVWACGRLYCVSKSGVVYVLAASDQFKQFGRVPLGEPSFATPAIANGVIYWRTESHLYSLGAKP